MPNPTDPIWGVIGVGATILFGIVGVIGVVVTFRQLVQNRKGLSYKIESITPVLRVEQGLNKKIEILLDGEPVRDVHLILITLINTGNSSIKPVDYERAVSITIQGEAKILSIEVVEKHPKRLGEVVEDSNNTCVIFKKILLNSKDYFTLKLLVSDFSGNTTDLYVDGRIDGVKDIVEVRESRLAKALIEVALTSTGPSAILGGVISGILGSAISTLFIQLTDDLSNRKNRS